MQLHFSGVVQLVRCCDGIRDLFRDGRLLLDSCLVFDELNDNGSELFQNLNDDQVAILRRVVLMFNLLFNLGDNLSDLEGETCRGPLSPSRFHVYRLTTGVGMETSFSLVPTVSTTNPLSSFKTVSTRESYK